MQKSIYLSHNKCSECGKAKAWVCINVRQLSLSGISSVCFFFLLSCSFKFNREPQYLPSFSNYCSLDKALHSAGFDSGFIILGTNLTNPLNMLLPVLQRVSKEVVICIYVRMLLCFLLNFSLSNSLKQHCLNVWSVKARQLPY